MPNVFKKELMIERIQKFTDSNILSIINQKTAYSNYVYIIETENGKYVYKEYNSKTKIVDRNEEINVQIQIGFPKILEYKENYRIEEFVENDAVDLFSDLEKIAYSLKNFLKKKVNCNLNHEKMLKIMMEKQLDFFDKNNKNLQTINSSGLSSVLYQTTENLKITVVLENIYNRINELIKCEESFICHNDLQIGNMMKINDKVEFIDFEYSCLGNPLVDIANFFCETMCDYDSDFILKKDKGYSRNEKKRFLEIYFGKIDVDYELDRIEDLKCFSHFYWFLWSRYLYQSKLGPSITFNYKKYCISRLEFLLESKLINLEEFTLLNNI
ncbi:hypothetical protein GVAV_003557 [Gurleya vavrai]